MICSRATYSEDASWKRNKYKNTSTTRGVTETDSQAPRRSGKENRDIINISVGDFETEVSYYGDMSRKKTSDMSKHTSNGTSYDRDRSRNRTDDRNSFKNRSDDKNSSKNRSDDKSSSSSGGSSRRKKADPLPADLEGVSARGSSSDPYAPNFSDGPSREDTKEIFTKANKSKRLPSSTTDKHSQKMWKQLEEQRKNKKPSVAERREIREKEELRAAKQLKKDTHQSTLSGYQQKPNTPKTRRGDKQRGSSVRSTKTRRGAAPLASTKRAKNESTEYSGDSSDDEDDTRGVSARGRSASTSSRSTTSAPAPTHRDRSMSVSGEGSFETSPLAERRNSRRSADNTSSKTSNSSTNRDIWNHKPAADDKGGRALGNNERSKRRKSAERESDATGGVDSDDEVPQRRKRAKKADKMPETIRNVDDTRGEIPKNEQRVISDESESEPDMVGPAPRLKLRTKKARKSFEVGATTKVRSSRGDKVPKSARSVEDNNDMRYTRRQTGLESVRKEVSDEDEEKAISSERVPDTVGASSGEGVDREDDLHGKIPKKIRKITTDESESEPDPIEPAHKQARHKPRKRKAPKTLPDMPGSEGVPCEVEETSRGDKVAKTGRGVEDNNNKRYNQRHTGLESVQKGSYEKDEEKAMSNEQESDIERANNREGKTPPRSTLATDNSLDASIPETPVSGPISSPNLASGLVSDGDSVGTGQASAKNLSQISPNTSAYAMPARSSMRAALKASVSDYKKESDVTTKKSDVTTKQSDVTTKESDVTTKQSDVITEGGAGTGPESKETGASSGVDTDVANAPQDESEEVPAPRRRKLVSMAMPEKIAGPAEDDEDTLKIPKKRGRPPKPTTEKLPTSLSAVDALEDLGKLTDSDENKPTKHSSRNKTTTTARTGSQSQSKGKGLVQQGLFGLAVKIPDKAKRGRPPTKRVPQPVSEPIDSDSESDHHSNGRRKKKPRAGSAASASKTAKHTASVGADSAGKRTPGRPKGSKNKSTTSRAKTTSGKKSKDEKLLANEPKISSRKRMTVDELNLKAKSSVDGEEPSASVVNTSTSAYTKGKKNQMSQSDSEDDDENSGDGGELNDVLNDPEFSAYYNESFNTLRLSNINEQDSDSDGLSDADEDADGDEEWQRILQQMRKYRSDLRDIKNGKQKSTRHKMFIGAPGVRSQLKFMTAKAHLSSRHYTRVTKTLLEWFAPARLENSNNYLALQSYTWDVLLPEMMIRLVQEENDCSYSDAEKIMLSKFDNE